MPGGWTFGARRTTSIVAALLLLVSVPFSGMQKPALGAEQRMPFETFFELYLDQPRRHVFVSGGPGTNGVLVYGFDGRLIKRIGDLPGAADLVVEGNRMYVALSSSNAIAVVDLKKLETVETIELSTYAEPFHLGKIGNVVYFSYACTEHGGNIASVDLENGLVLEHDDVHAASCAEFAALPNEPQAMFVWDSEGASRITRMNVSTRRPIPIASSDEYLGDVTFSADGETFFASRTEPYADGSGLDQRRIGDFSLVRNYPKAGPAYAVSPDERMLFASSSDYDTDLLVYRKGGAAPILAMDLDDSDDFSGEENIYPEGLAAPAGGDRVFAVVFNYDYDTGTYPLAFRVIWPQYRVAAGPGAQSTPAAGAGYDVWSTRPPRAKYVALVVRKGGKTFRVNPPRTSGYAGGVDGTKLVYQLVRGRQSDLRLYDLARRRHVSTLARMNTRGWEWHPTMSEGRVLFTRQSGKTSQVILQSLKGGPPRVLARETGPSVLVAGQVNGPYAVWTVCGRTCDVYRKNVRTGARARVPRASGRINYGASVTPGGTVYYMQSGYRCGTNAELLRYTGGRVTEIEDLRVGKDGFFTYADDTTDRVLFDLATCGPRGAGIGYDVLAFRDSPVRRDRAGVAAPDPGDDEPLPPLEGEPWFDGLLPGGPR